MAQDNDNQLIILAGVVGSGKSTLSVAWEGLLPGWVRVNQDDLGDRRTCEVAVRQALKTSNVILDRQNFDVDQRRTWMEIASEFNGVKVGGMVMGTPKDECRARLLARQQHPTIDNPELAVSLLEKFSSLWVEPTLQEGFDHLITLPALPPPSQLTADLIHSLLSQLYSSPSNPSAALQRRPRPRNNAPTSAYVRPDFTDDGTWRPPAPSSSSNVLGSTTSSLPPPVPFAPSGQFGIGTGGRHLSPSGTLGFGGHTGFGGVAGAGGHSYRPPVNPRDGTVHEGSMGRYQPSRPHVPFGEGPFIPGQEYERPKVVEGAYEGIRGGYEAATEGKPHNWGSGGRTLGGAPQ